MAARCSIHEAGQRQRSMEIIHYLPQTSLSEDRLSPMIPLWLVAKLGKSQSQRTVDSYRGTLTAFRIFL